MDDDALTDILAAHREGVSTSTFGRGLMWAGECSCGKFTYDDVTGHDRHVEDMMAAANLVTVALPEPDEDDTVRPYWSVTDIDGPQVVAVADSDGSVQEDWVSIQFTARYRTVDVQTARAIGLAFLAAADAARSTGEKS